MLFACGNCVQLVHGIDMIDFLSNPAIKYNFLIQDYKVNSTCVLNYSVNLVDMLLHLSWGTNVLHYSVFCPSTIQTCFDEAASWPHRQSCKPVKRGRTALVIQWSV